MVIGIVSFILGLYFCLFQEINTDDETWFLQIVNRIVSGEKLYKEVFFSSTPLSVYLAAMCCKFSGAELILLRGLLALYFSLSVVFSCAILRQLKVTSTFSVFLILTFFLFSHPQASWGFSGYNGLAKVFFLGCFLFTLKWIRIPSLSHLLLSSLCAGLAFCAKQNVGLLAFAGILTTYTFYRRDVGPQGRKASREVLIILATFFLTACAGLFPIFYQHSFKEFFEHCFFNKKNYFLLNHCNYFLFPSSWDSYSIFIFAAPALLSAAYLFSRKNSDPYFAAVWIFLIASVVTLFPRPDNIEKMTFVPVVFIVLYYSYSYMKERMSSHIVKTMKYGSACWIIVGMSLYTFSSLNELFSGKNEFSTLPHFRSVFINSHCYKHWRAMKNQFASFPQNKYTNVFFLSTHAGFYYLLFDVKNPTFFDYPIKTALDSRGEVQLEKQIQSGQILTVFTDHANWSNWNQLQPSCRPYRLENFIKQNMEPEYVIDEGSLTMVFQVYKKNQLPNIIGFDGVKRCKLLHLPLKQMTLTRAASLE